MASLSRSEYERDHMVKEEIREQGKARFTNSFP
jgi:hypothetical protein